MRNDQKKRASEMPFFFKYLQNQWNDTPDICENEEAGERIWNNVLLKYKAEKLHASPIHKYKLSFLKTIAASAAVFILLFGGYWLHQKPQLEVITYLAKEEKLHVILPDSSSVWLNVNSKIEYLSDFLTNRNIQLEGEAFFDVRKSKGSPFKVLFQDALVEVKGTAFNIKSYLEEPAQISLFTGKIEFDAPAIEKITLSPFDRITYNQATETILLEHNISDPYDWRTEMYRFRDRRLDELIVTINRIYNSNIILENTRHAHSLFSGSIRKEEPLLDVVEKLCITLNLKHRANEKEIILY